MEFDVSGMTCQHCVQRVTRAVQALDASARVRVDLAQGRVAVETAAAPEAVARAIAAQGYEVRSRPAG